VTGYIQYYKKNGGTDTKAMGQTEPQTGKKKFSPTMLIYQNHKQLKTNTSHNDRALSVTIHTGERGKKY
jgi:hypothetical protein